MTVAQRVPRLSLTTLTAHLVRVRRASRLQAPLELDPRSPLFNRFEWHSALIAVGAALGVTALGVTAGLLALLG